MKTTKLAQSKLILEELRKGRKLTPLDALHKIGSFRLGARIYDLRQEGHNIVTDLKTLSSGQRVAVYSLKK